MSNIYQLQSGSKVLVRFFKWVWHWNGISQVHEILYTFLSQCKATILKISRVQLVKISINDLIKDKNLVLKVVHLALLIFLLKTALNELKCNWKLLWKSNLLFLSDLYLKFQCHIRNYLEKSIIWPHDFDHFEMKAFISMIN